MKLVKAKLAPYRGPGGKIEGGGRSPASEGGGQDREGRSPPK
jgi:hypothetical protein